MTDATMPPPTVLAKLEELIKSIAETADPDATRRAIRARLSTNPIMMADMYKASHAAQLPKDTTLITSFFEAREGSELPHIVNFGLQMLLDEIAAIRILKEDVDEAKDFFAKTFGAEDVFNEAGWRASRDRVEIESRSIAKFGRISHELLVGRRMFDPPTP